MGEEENILQTIISKESWEDVIYYIVNVENLDPWNIDLVKLTHAFIKYIQAAQELDFRIPAKIVFIAAILLRLKANYLSIFEEEEEESVEKPVENLDINPDLVQLGYPIRRVPKRQITLEELMQALRKAMAVEKRKEERKKFLQSKLTMEISFEEDINKRIEKVMKDIEDLMEKLKVDKVEFKKVVGKWKKDKVVEYFVPVLHLDQEKKIELEQPEILKEIWIGKKDKNTS
jgi:chromatin segregation and condensation protein Rec8/ScpA/Scc1 (kleisin family)